MTEQVSIRLRGRQKQAGETDMDMAGDAPIEVRAEGVYRFSDGRHSVEFVERSEEDGAETHSRLVYDEAGNCELIRSGEVETRMVFAPGKRHAFRYGTPYGAMEMEISTGNVRMRAWEDRHILRIGYGLTVNGEYQADCTMDIRIEAGAKKSC